MLPARRTSVLKREWGGSSESVEFGLTWMSESAIFITFGGKYGTFKTKIENTFIEKTRSCWETHLPIQDVVWALGYKSVSPWIQSNDPRMGGYWN
jgi:hypothetical protein